MWEGGESLNERKYVWSSWETECTSKYEGVMLIRLSSKCLDAWFPLECNTPCTGFSQHQLTGQHRWIPKTTEQHTPILESSDPLPWLSTDLFLFNNHPDNVYDSHLSSAAAYFFFRSLQATLEAPKHTGSKISHLTSHDTSSRLPASRPLERRAKLQVYADLCIRPCRSGIFFSSPRNSNAVTEQTCRAYEASSWQAKLSLCLPIGGKAQYRLR